MAAKRIEIERGARDGLARTLRTTIAGTALAGPLLLQCVTADAAPVGRPAAVLAAPGAKPLLAGAVAFGWGPSPLFGSGGRSPTATVELPRLVPRAYGVGQLSEPESLTRLEGELAGALPSKSGSEHLRTLAEGASLVALQNLSELKGRPREFVRALAGAREALGPRPLLYAASVADPANVSLMIYLGADVVDDFSAVLGASSGIFLYDFGGVEGGVPGACHCRACHDYFGDHGEEHAPDARGGESNSGRPAAPGGDSEDVGAEFGEGRGAAARRDFPSVRAGSPLFLAALGHNRRAIGAQVRIAARAIEEGTLRELVESRVRAHPWLVAALRNADREFYGPMEALTPIWKKRLHALSHESLNRPEVRRWGDRLRERYRPPPSARVLLLVPCSARKPYSLSKTQRSIDRALAGVRPSYAVHRVVVTSPLGLVPEELERVFPAAHYDIPVTGDWAREEVARVEEQLLMLLQAHAYAGVVSLVGDDLPSLSQTTAGLVECAAEGRPFDDALKRCADALTEMLKGSADVAPRRRLLEDMASLARFQFGGPAAASLMERVELRGRPPWVRIFSGEEQLAMHFPDKGRLALTLPGARRVAAGGSYRVTIEDFRLRGDVFAVGVTGADPEIREGDSVAVVQNGEVVASGFARLSAAEMSAMGRGAAVDVRHAAGMAPKAEVAQ